MNLINYFLRKRWYQSLRGPAGQSKLNAQENVRRAQCKSSRWKYGFLCNWINAPPENLYALTRERWARAPDPFARVHVDRKRIKMSININLRNHGGGSLLCSLDITSNLGLPVAPRNNFKYLHRFILAKRMIYIATQQGQGNSHITGQDSWNICDITDKEMISHPTIHPTIHNLCWGFPLPPEIISNTYTGSFKLKGWYI